MWIIIRYVLDNYEVPYYQKQSSSLWVHFGEFFLIWQPRFFIFQDFSIVILSSRFFALDFYDSREIDTLSASMTRHASCLPARLKWHVVNQQVLSTPPATIYFAQRCYGQINWIVVIRNLGHKADEASSLHDNFSNNNAVKCFCGKHFRSIIGLMLFEVFVFVVILR